MENPRRSTSQGYLDGELHDLVENYFRLESIGDSKKANMSARDQRAMSLLESTTRKCGGCWETGLLWRADNVALPDNKEYALRRLYNLEKKLDRDPERAKLYCKEIDKFVSQGYASKEHPIRGEHGTSLTLLSRTGRNLAESGSSLTPPRKSKVRASITIY